MWEYLQTALEALGYVFAIIGVGASAYQAYQAWSSITRLSWGDVDKQSRKLIRRIAEDGYQPDIIVTIGRGGAIVGSILSGNLPAPEQKRKKNIPILGVDRMYRWENGQRIEVENKLVDFAPLKGQKVLIVAGDLITGGTMRHFVTAISSSGVADLRSACLLKGVSATFIPDYFAKEITADFQTPWMYKGYGYARDSRHPADYREPSLREKWRNRIT